MASLALISANAADMPARRPSPWWWLLGLLLFAASLIVQLPAAWLVKKFAPNNPYLQHVSGNLWHGQANWQLGVRPNQPLVGTVDWQWQPWRLLTGNMGFAVKIDSRQTHLTGDIALGRKAWQVIDLSGKIAPETLRQLVDWQLPDTPLVLKNVQVKKTKQGYPKAEGALNWTGGEVGYPNAGRVYQLNLPTILGTLSSEMARGANNASTNGATLHLALTNEQGQRLGDLRLDNDGMLDVALTQRLLKTMPKYQGKGVDDSVIVTTRQPIGALR